VLLDLSQYIFSLYKLMVSLVYFYLFFFEQTKMKYHINNVDCLAQGMQKATHSKVFTETMCQTRNDTKTNTKRKLQMNTHTKKRVTPPVMVTVTKKPLF
jgi:hypothetical protein